MRYRDWRKGLLWGVMTVQAGCLWQTYTPKPLAPDLLVERFESRDLLRPEVRQFLIENGHPPPAWPPGAWDLRALELAAVFFHPDLALARSEIDLARVQQVTAAARPNPTFGLTSQHHSDTSGGRTPWSIGAALDWVFERPAKRAARVERAQAMADAARVDLDARIWEVRSGVRDRLLDYYEAAGRAQVLQEQTALLEEGVRLVRRREELGQASSFEVSSMRLEAQRARLAMSGVEAKAQRAVAALAGAMGLPIQAINNINLDTTLFQKLPEDSLLAAQRLQRTALTTRADIRRGLKDYAVAEASLKEEIARQYPDVTLSPGYLFDQADNVWSLGASFILPLLDRNQGPIAEAMARRELEARRFESLQSRVIGSVQQARVGYTVTRKSVADAQAVIDSLVEQETRIRRQFELGDTDRLSLVRARLETLNARMAQQDLHVEAWRALAHLEDTVQSAIGRPAVALPAEANL